MTQLALAVDTDDELWTLDDLPTPEAPYVEVGDELVEVRSRFPSSYYTLTGETLPPRIRVRRGIAGTTKASHVQGSTLTPNYGLGSGEGGGAIAVDNLVDPPAEVTTIIAVGAEIAGDEATLRGKDFYAQDTDPGAVGTGSVWKDTVGNVWWERNATDDGWDARFTPSVEGVPDAEAAVSLFAVASGLGAAYAGASATATDGNAYAGAAATTTDGNADARPQAYTTTGEAVVGPVATATDGNASAGAAATTTGPGLATVRATATATDGDALAGSIANRAGVLAGMAADVDGLGVAHLGFNAMVGAPPTIPELPATPTEQDIADVLVALGLATQAA